MALFLTHFAFRLGRLVVVSTEMQKPMDHVKGLFHGRLVSAFRGLLLRHLDA